MLTAIHTIAEEVVKQIRAMGGDPNDPSVVTTYVKGCNFPRLIGKAVEESLEGEDYVAEE